MSTRAPVFAVADRRRDDRLNSVPKSGRVRDSVHHEFGEHRGGISHDQLAPLLQRGYVDRSCLETVPEFVPMLGCRNDDGRLSGQKRKYERESRHFTFLFAA